MNSSSEFLTDIRDLSQLSGVQSGNSVTGIFTLNGQSNLLGKIDLSSGSDFVPVWSLTPKSTPTGETVGVGEGIWTVLDNGYIKFTGKLTTAKELGLENKTYSGTINATFTSNNGNSMPVTVTYGGKLFFKVIENQVVALAIPKPVSDKLSSNFTLDPDGIVGKIIPEAWLSYDKINLAISDILNRVDPENKIWSSEIKKSVSGNFGNVGCALENIRFNIATGLTQALTNKE